MWDRGRVCGVDAMNRAAVVSADVLCFVSLFCASEGLGRGCCFWVGLDPLALIVSADMIVGLGNDIAVPPEQLYASQLSQLQEMGFIDTQENIRALSAVGGNVHAAVERLLGNLG